MQVYGLTYELTHSKVEPSKGNTPEEFRQIIDLLMKLEGIEVELCGSWLWIGGNTKEHKDALKAAGCRWCSKKKLWSWHHPEEGVLSRIMRKNICRLG